MQVKKKENNDVHLKWQLCPHIVILIYLHLAKNDQLQIFLAI